MLLNFIGETIHVVIDPSRDALLTDFGKATLQDRYLLPGETCQDMFARVAAAYADDSEHAQRLYDYMSKHWFMPATPVLSNGGTERGYPISCFLNNVPDDINGIRNVWNENVMLAARGGGIGTSWSDVRSIDEKIGEVGRTSGIIPFIKVQDSLTLAISQGSLRRGSAAVYLDISHPEIEEFLDMRRVKGDPNRRSLNLHHGVTISDAFMEAVEAGADWDLISPKDGTIRKTVSARTLWQKILTARLEEGEPYIVFSDTVNRMLPEVYKRLGLKVRQSNLCVAPETTVLTNMGHIPISELAGSETLVWNGFEWSQVTVRKTGENQKLVTVTLSDGSTLDCTPYHKFYVIDDYHKAPREVRANELEPGMKLMKGELPLVTTGKNLPDAYYNGFFCGDGTYDRQGNALIYFYGNKASVANDIEDVFGANVHIRYQSGGDRDIAVVKKGVMRPKFEVPHDGDINSRVEWFAGLLDSDGCVTRNGEAQSIQLSNTNKEFLRQVQLMLQTLGVQSKITLMHEDRTVTMPDGKGGSAEYDCKAVYRLMFGEKGVQQLLSIGLISRKHCIEIRIPQREASQFVKVVSVEDHGRFDDTYCFEEPKRHLGVFNGILTGQCSEIALHTGIDHLGNDRTAVCCLSSLNMATMDEWYGNEQFVRDVLCFLDNVLEDFIRKTEGVEGFEKARYSAMRERSIGLGVMGYHTYLQRKNIPYESALAHAINLRTFKWLKSVGDKVNQDEAVNRGPCPDAVDAGLNVRWSHMFSVAPTASISIICASGGTTSPGVEPHAANVFTQKTLSGSFEVRNAELDKVIERHAIIRMGIFPECSEEEFSAMINDFKEQAWKQIRNDEGSVQNLKFLSADEKDVFKTFLEIDQRWVVSHAAARAPFIDQMASNNISLPADVHKRDLHLLHVKAWKDGVPSLYYLRSKSKQRGGKVDHMAGEMPQPGPTKEIVLQDRGEAVEYVEKSYDECLSCQ